MLVGGESVGNMHVSSQWLDEVIRIPYDYIFYFVRVLLVDSAFKVRLTGVCSYSLMVVSKFVLQIFENFRAGVLNSRNKTSKIL